MDQNTFGILKNLIDDEMGKLYKMSKNMTAKSNSSKNVLL